jgi:hypothetical protein
MGTTDTDYAEWKSLLEQYNDLMARYWRANDDSNIEFAMKLWSESADLREKMRAVIERP